MMVSFLWPSPTAQPPQLLFLLLVLPHLMTLAKLKAAYSTCRKTHSVPKQKKENERTLGRLLAAGLS